MVPARPPSPSLNLVLGIKLRDDQSRTVSRAAIYYFFFWSLAYCGLSNFSTALQVVSDANMWFDAPHPSESSRMADKKGNRHGRSDKGMSDILLVHLG